MQFWPKSCQNISQFEILVSREPNMLESSMTPHFKGKGLYFIVKKILWRKMFEFLLTSAQIFNFFSCFCLKLCWFIILDWDLLAGQKILWRLSSAFALNILCKRSEIIKILYADVSNFAIFLVFRAKFLIKFYFELKTCTNTNNSI